MDVQIPSLVIGEIHELYSYALEENRRLLIHLPTTYKESKQDHPVLYLLDGEKHFQHVVSTTDFLAQHHLIPPLIIIGIVNVDRTKDLTPAKAYDRQFPSAGKADDFLRFLKRELIPWVKKQYRTNDYQIIAGHSFGGLFSIYALIQQPKLFDAILAISPSLWWNNELYVEEVQELLSKKPLSDKRIFLSWGKEGKKMEQPAERLAKAFANHYADNYQSSYEFMKQETHETIVNRAIYNGLSHIFKGWAIHELVDLEGLKAHYESLRATWGFISFPPEDLVDDLAFQWMAKKQASRAIDLLIFNTKIHQSPFTYYRLGEGYELIGEAQKAKIAFLAAYQLAIDINDPQLERYRFRVESRK